MDGGMDDQALKVDVTPSSNALPCEANALLRLLNDADRAALAPHLELVPFRNGDMIARAGDAADSICFPLTGIAAVNRRPKRPPYRRAKGTPFVEQRDGYRDGYNGRTVRAGCGVGRA